MCPSAPQLATPMATWHLVNTYNYSHDLYNYSSNRNMPVHIGNLRDLEIFAAVRWDMQILCCVLELGRRNTDGKKRATAERARKRSFVGAASKSMHFAGRQFVCVDASLRVCVRTSACISACLCDTVTYAAECCRSSPVHQCIIPDSIATFPDLPPTTACSVHFN